MDLWRSKPFWPSVLDCWKLCLFCMLSLHSLWFDSCDFSPCIGNGLIIWFWFCVFAHSLANLIAFDAVSRGVLDRFSKINMLRDDHIAQHIHKMMLPDMPVGGRQTACLHAATISLKSIHVARWTTSFRGISFQTSCAKEQWKKVWVADSIPLHLVHIMSDWIPPSVGLFPMEWLCW